MWFTVVVVVVVIVIVSNHNDGDNSGMYWSSILVESNTGFFALDRTLGMWSIVFYIWLVTVMKRHVFYHINMLVRVNEMVPASWMWIPDD
jgi:hypothetical protein